MTDCVDKTLEISLADDMISVSVDGKIIAVGKLVQKSFSKIGLIEDYQFIIEEKIEEYGI